MARTREEILADVYGAPTVVVPTIDPNIRRSQLMTDVYGTAPVVLDPGHASEQENQIEINRLANDVRRDERLAIRNEAQQSLTDEEVDRRLEERMYDKGFSGLTAGFDNELPPIRPAPPIELPRTSQVGITDALRPQSTIGRSRAAARTAPLSPPSSQTYVTMQGMLSADDYSGLEDVSRADTTEYVGFRSAVKKYVDDNYGVDVETASNAVQAQLAELPTLIGGGSDPSRYYEGADIGDVGPNDPWYRAFSRRREAGSPVPILTPYQQEYMNASLKARQEEFYPDIDEAIDEEIPSYEAGDIEDFEVEGGLTEEDLVGDVQTQRDDRISELETEYGLDPLPFWTGSDTEYIMSNLEEFSEGGVWNKTYADAATVEGPAQWLLRSAFMIPNMAGSAVYQGATGAGFHPGLTGEELEASETARMDETPLYRNHPYLRNIATGQSLTNDAYAMYHYGPEATKHWAPIAGAAGFLTEVLLVPLDGGISSVAKGASAAAKISSASRSLGLGRNLSGAARAGLARAGQDLGAQAPGLGFAARKLGLRPGDPTIMLAAQTADYIDETRHINAWQRVNPSASVDDTIDQMRRFNPNGRLADQTAATFKRTGEIPEVFKVGGLTDELIKLDTSLYRFWDGATELIPQRRWLTGRLGLAKGSDSVAIRTALNEVGVDAVMKNAVWDAATSMTVRAMDNASVGRELRLLTPKVAINDSQLGDIVKLVDNDDDYKFLRSIFEDGNGRNIEFQNLDLHTNTGKRVNYNTEIRSGVEITTEQGNRIIKLAKGLAREGYISRHAWLKIVEEIKPGIVNAAFGKSRRLKTVGNKVSTKSVRAIQTAMLERVALSERIGISTKAWDSAADATKTRLMTPIGARQMWVTPKMFKAGVKKIGKVVDAALGRKPTKPPLGKMRSLEVEATLTTFRNSLHEMSTVLQRDMRRLASDPAYRARYGLNDASTHDDMLMALTFGGTAERGAYMTSNALNEIIKTSILREEYTLKLMDALSPGRVKAATLRFTDAGTEAKQALIAAYTQRIKKASTNDIKRIVDEFFDEITSDAFAKNPDFFHNPEKATSVLARSDLPDVMSGVYYQQQSRRLAKEVHIQLANQSPEARLFRQAYEDISDTISRDLKIGKWTDPATGKAIDDVFGTTDEGAAFGKTGEDIDEAADAFDYTGRVTYKTDDMMNFDQMLQARIRRILNNGDESSMIDGVIEDTLRISDPDGLAKAKSALSMENPGEAQSLVDIVDSVDRVARQVIRANGMDAGNVLDDITRQIDDVFTRVKRTTAPPTTVDEAFEAFSNTSVKMEREFDRLVFGGDPTDAVNIAVRGGRNQKAVRNELLKLHGLSSDVFYTIADRINHGLNMLTSFRYTAMLGAKLPFHMKNNVSAPTIIWATLGGENAASAIKNYPEALAIWNRGAYSRAGTASRKITNAPIKVVAPDGRVYMGDELYDMAIGSGAMKSQASFILSEQNLARMMDDAKMTGQAKTAMNKLVSEYGGAKPFVKWLQDMTEYEDQVWRLSSVISAIKRGDDPISALNSGRLSLMDYHAMSPIERVASTKFMMFYAFTRASAAVLTKNIFNNPKRLFNLYKTQQLPGILGGYDPASTSGFFKPDYLLPKIITDWVDDDYTTSYYETFGEIPIMDTMRMFAEATATGIGERSPVAGAGVLFKEMVSDKINPTARTILGLDTVFEYTASYVDERDMFALPSSFWDVMIGEQPVGEPLVEGQRGYMDQRWMLSDEGMERYVRWKEYVAPFLSTSTWTDSIAPLLGYAWAKDSMAGSSRMRPEELIGFEKRIGTFPRHGTRASVQREIINRNKQDEY